LSDKIKINSLDPRTITAIIEILNSGRDAKITIGREGVTVYETSTKKKYSENIAVNGQR
jgi:hypothetical protein